MNRKNFLATLGIVAGGSVALGKTGYRLPGYILPAPAGDDIWPAIRDEFSFPDGFVYLNTGGIGSVPRHVRSLFSDSWFQLETNPTPGHDTTRWNQLKKEMALFLGKDVDPSEIGLVNTATEGINIILNGYPFEKGDEIITSTHEHVALNVPLLNQVKRKGAVIRTFEPDRSDNLNNVKLIGNLITKKTRMVFITHRTTTTGQLLPVREIGQMLRARDIRFAVDGAQAPGSMPIDLKELMVDYYAFSCHKWMLAPRRTGVLYVSKDKLETLAPITVGAYSDNGFSLKDGTLNFQPSAQRFEYGTQNELLYMGMHASLRFINSIGVERIRKHNEELSESFYSQLSQISDCELLSPVERSARSSMITFRLKSKPFGDVTTIMGKDNIRVRPVGEGGMNGVRVSFHLYNDRSDLDRAMESIRKIVKG
ncbi:MAG TPA: aminotransferase class V-fold PLP-dependent enzyme [Bacteroidales bacterium]|nr:aminotransferase class V-fold PLP-dependent enzyme [Bacteroidales bacterium]